MKLNKRNFLSYINKNFVFESNPKIAVAVSGGPDSMALLHLLNNWSKTVKGKINALIIDHKLRNNSKEEALSISQIIKNYNINVKVLSVNKDMIISKSMSEARINRYNLLTEYCKKNKISYLFLGHHFDDNLETFVNRKISGSDFDGLQSIKEISLRNKTCLIRPLLNYSKNEILNYNSNNNIPFIEDPSNKNFHYTRPIIRKFMQDADANILKEIINEFELIKKNSMLYNQMISELLINSIKAVEVNFINLNYNYFAKLNVLLSEKIVKMAYNFFYNQKVSPRSKKIQSFIVNAKEKEFKIFNLKGMIIKKANNSLIFTKKTN